MLKSVLFPVPLPVSYVMYEVLNGRHNNPNNIIANIMSMLNGTSYTLHEQRSLTSYTYILPTIRVTWCT